MWDNTSNNTCTLNSDIVNLPTLLPNHQFTFPLMNIKVLVSCTLFMNEHNKIFKSLLLQWMKYVTSLVLFKWIQISTNPFVTKINCRLNKHVNMEGKFLQSWKSWAFLNSKPGNCVEKACSIGSQSYLKSDILWNIFLKCMWSLFVTLLKEDYQLITIPYFKTWKNF